MNVTVYVPDDLWHQARARASDRNPSQLVQDALRDTLAQLRTPFSPDTPIAPDVVAEIAAAKAAEARASFSSGYSKGLDLAKEWSWEILDGLARKNFALEDFIDDPSGVDEFPIPGDPDHVWTSDHLRDHLGDVGWNSGGELFRVGLQQALRDVWHATLDGATADS
jgi:hypothetical protein